MSVCTLFRYMQIFICSNSIMIISHAFTKTPIVASIPKHISSRFCPSYLSTYFCISPDYWRLAFLFLVWHYLWQFILTFHVLFCLCCGQWLNDDYVTPFARVSLYLSRNQSQWNWSSSRRFLLFFALFILHEVEIQAYF